MGCFCYVIIVPVSATGHTTTHITETTTPMDTTTTTGQNVQSKKVVTTSPQPQSTVLTETTTGLPQTMIQTTTQSPQQTQTDTQQPQQTAGVKTGSIAVISATEPTTISHSQTTNIPNETTTQGPKNNEPTTGIKVNDISTKVPPKVVHTTTASPYYTTKAYQHYQYTSTGHSNLQDKTTYHRFSTTLPPLDKVYHKGYYVHPYRHTVDLPPSNHGLPWKPVAAHSHKQIKSQGLHGAWLASVAMEPVYKFLNVTGKFLFSILKVYDKSVRLHEINT